MDRRFGPKSYVSQNDLMRVQSPFEPERTYRPVNEILAGLGELPEKYFNALIMDPLENMSNVGGAMLGKNDVSYDDITQAVIDYGMPGAVFGSMQKPSRTVFRALGGDDVKRGSGPVDIASPKFVENKMFKQLAYNPAAESGGSNLVEQVYKAGFDVVDDVMIRGDIRKTIYIDNGGNKKYGYSRFISDGSDAIYEDSIISIKPLPENDLDNFFIQAEKEYGALMESVKGQNLKKQQIESPPPNDWKYWEQFHALAQKEIDKNNAMLKAKYGGDMKKVWEDPNYKSSAKDLLPMARELERKHRINAMSEAGQKPDRRKKQAFRTKSGGIVKMPET